MADAMRWLAMAEADLAVAEHLHATMIPVPVEIICYHCQQAGEKAAKAMLVHCGEEVKRTHDIALLVDMLSARMTIDEAVNEAAERLTPYGVQVRYPQEMQLEERHAQEALTFAHRLIGWAQNQLNMR